jgi:hypothetical protein
MELTKRATSIIGRAVDVGRARLTLPLAEGWDNVVERLECRHSFTSRWDKRFAE